MRLTSLLSILVLCSLCGCGASSAPAIRVLGDPEEVRSLAGSWSGTFRNTEMRREGKIDFRMSANADSAFGEVTMYLDRPDVPIWSHPEGIGGGRSAPPTPWRRIRFVRAEGGHVSGEMEAIYDTQYRRWMVARFVGRRRGDVIEGSYTSRSDDGVYETSGSWRVERVAESGR